MALSFLGSLGSTFGKIAPVAQGIGGLIDAIQGPRRYNDIYRQAGQPTAGEMQAQALYGALAQPNNSYVRQMSEAEMRANTEALLSQLRSMALTDRRAQLRGQRGTFFNPERADETIDFLVSRGAPAMRTQAEQTARSNIASSAAGLMGNAVLESQRQSNQLNMRLAQEALRAKSGGYAGQIGQLGSGLEDLIRAIGGGAQRRPSSTFVGPMPYQKGLF